MAPWRPECKRNEERRRLRVYRGRIRPGAVNESTMSDALATYLHDHLAGSTFGIDLLERLLKDDAGHTLAGYGHDLLRELQEDRATLKALMKQAEVGNSELKQAGAWLGEKLSRWKWGGATDRFSLFESLEMLSLGILGKQKLWRALQAAAPAEARLRGWDFESLAVRAHEQHTQVERRRLELAGTTLAQGS